MTQKQIKGVFIYADSGYEQVGCIVIVASDKKEADTILSKIKYSEDYTFEMELDLDRAGVVYSNYSYSMKKE